MKMNLKMIGAAALMCAFVSCMQMHPAHYTVVQVAHAPEVKLNQDNFRVFAARGVGGG